MDPLEEKFGPLVSEEPCAPLDTTYVLKGTYVTLENLQNEHLQSLWDNFDFLGAGASIEDYLPGKRTESIEHLRKEFKDIQSAGVITYAIKANPARLGPGASTAAEGGHDQVIGMIHYDATQLSSRAVEIGLIMAKSLQRTVAATEAHYLWLRNVCEPDSPGAMGGKSPPFRRVFWKCNHLNIYSKRCAERIGYKLEGTMRKAMIAKGRSRDTDIYAFVDDEWPAIRDALELWLHKDNFDEAGQQRRRLEDIRKSLA